MSGFSVYTHTNRKTGKVYVGITSMKPNQRWENGNGYRKNKKFFDDIEKYGWDGFDHEIIATDLTEKQAVSVEKALIAGYESTGRGYNKSAGGKYVTKCALNSTANQIKNAMKSKLEVYPELVEYIDLFERAEASGADSLICQNINIHCVEIVKLLERHGDSPNYSDEIWLSKFVFWLKRNTIACQYLECFGTLKGFDEAYPSYWEFMHEALSGGKKKIDTSILGIAEKIESAKSQ